MTEHDRSKFLGGSDAAAVMGLSPWHTPVELWQLKTGRVQPEPPDPVRLKMLERGKKLEPFIRDMAVDKLRDMGLAVELVAVNERHSDIEHPFLSCEVDFEMRVTGTVLIGEREVTFDNEVINADAKSVSGFARRKWGETDTEDVPIEYAAQFMHGLGITGRRACAVAALRSFDDVEIFWTLRDDETIAAMRTKLASFWIDHVLADVPPDPLTFSDIKLLFPLDNGQATEATEDIAKAVAELRAVKEQIKTLEDREKILTFDIGEFISPNALLRFNGAEIATWKAQRQTRLDQSLVEHADIYRRVEDADGLRFEKIEAPLAEFSKSSVIRVLRLKKPKA